MARNSTPRLDDARRRNHSQKLPDCRSFAEFPAGKSLKLPSSIGHENAPRRLGGTTCVDSQFQSSDGDQAGWDI
jgi:hypothetical protein